MPIDIQRIQAICFDVDGTLSDTDDKWVQRVQRLLHPIRGLFPKKDTGSFSRWLIMGLESPGNFLYELLDLLHLDDKVAWLVSGMYRLRLDRNDQHYLITGADTLLRSLSQRYPLAVVSARGERSTLDFLNHFSLLPYFQAVATSQTCKYTKPFPDPVHWAAERMGVKAEHCLMVGDTTVDIRAGRAAGAQTVGVLCGFGYEGELRRAGADLILESTAELSGYID